MEYDPLQPLINMGNLTTSGVNTPECGGLPCVGTDDCINKTLDKICPIPPPPPGTTFKIDEKYTIGFLIGIIFYWMARKLYRGAMTGP